MRRSIEVAAGALALAALTAGIWVRVAPVDPQRWHVDPLAASPPGGNGWLVAPGGDAEPPSYHATPAALLSRLDRIAQETPRTRAIAGSVDEGRITYETRTPFWGFPDYTTVTVIERDGATLPVLLARARYGRRDLGVNRERVEAWLEALSS